mmetsp:Transcript_30626/g.99449  ORF Transcript_30626/g.99449 Transcript_30626/m.99449 type:complete len:80 (+) Transcript_30626:3819-4058(+)
MEPRRESLSLDINEYKLASRAFHCLRRNALISSSLYDPDEVSYDFGGAVSKGGSFLLSDVLVGRRVNCSLRRDYNIIIG